MKAIRHTWALLKACWAGFWRIKYPRSSAGDLPGKADPRPAATDPPTASVASH